MENQVGIPTYPGCSTDWCNRGCAIGYYVYVMMYVKIASYYSQEQGILLIAGLSVLLTDTLHGEDIMIKSKSNQMYEQLDYLRLDKEVSLFWCCFR